jgi:hypothetical protein
MPFDQSYWFTLLLIFLLSFMIILWLSGAFNYYPVSTDPNITLSNYRTKISGWSDPLTQDPCRLYDFYLHPPSFPISPSGIEALSTLCYDEDQLIARQITRQCQQDRCVGRDGRFYTKGETETTFVQCNNSQCAGLVLLRTKSADGSKYLYLNKFGNLGEKKGIVMEEIGPAGITEGHIFRLERTANPSASTTPSDEGIYARFVDRRTGEYLVPSSIPERRAYLEMVAPSAAANSGYQWVLTDGQDVSSGTASFSYPKQLAQLPYPLPIINSTDIFGKWGEGLLIRFLSGTIPGADPILHALPSAAGWETVNFPIFHKFDDPAFNPPFN